MKVKQKDHGVDKVKVVEEWLEVILHPMPNQEVPWSLSGADLEMGMVPKLGLRHQDERWWMFCMEMDMLVGVVTGLLVWRAVDVEDRSLAIGAHCPTSWPEDSHACRSTCWPCSSPSSIPCSHPISKYVMANSQPTLWPLLQSSLHFNIPSSSPWFLPSSYACFQRSLRFQPSVVCETAARKSWMVMMTVFWMKKSKLKGISNFSGSDWRSGDWVCRQWHVTRGSGWLCFFCCFLLLGDMVNCKGMWLSNRSGRVWKWELGLKNGWIHVLTVRIGCL